MRQGNLFAFVGKKSAQKEKTEEGHSQNNTKPEPPTTKQNIEEKKAPTTPTKRKNSTPKKRQPSSSPKKTEPQPKLVEKSPISKKTLDKSPLRKSVASQKASQKSVNSKQQPQKSEASQKSVAAANAVMKSDSEEDLGITRKKAKTNKRRIIQSESSASYESSEDDDHVLPPSKPLPQTNKRKRTLQESSSQFSQELEERKEPKRRKINESVPVDAEMKQARKKSSKRDRSSSGEKLNTGGRGAGTARTRARQQSPKKSLNARTANSKAEFASDSPSLDADELAAAVESDGASKWLDGLQFVVSGVFENIARDTLETFICDHGGRRTTAVSGKTDYLIIGSRMEDGRDIEFGGKYKKAQKCGTSILTEDKFEELVQELSGNVAFRFGEQRTINIDMVHEEPVQKVEENKSGKETQMWTEKYRPRSIRDLIGNSGVIDNLYNWLKDWDDVVMRGNKKQIKATGRFNWADAPKLNAAAALMSGPPGIGKTSSARIICASLGYEVIEMNASDTRNKSAIENRVKDLSQTKSLKYFSEAGIKKYEANTNPLASAIGGLATKKSVIIMDEVDGLGAGDRGGVAALCKVIKDTRTPIICICNDIQNRKLMSLKTHCYEMKFQRPNLGNIRDFVLRIVKQEGMDYINADIADRLIDSAGCDIRQVVNILQMWSQQHKSKIGDPEAALASKKDGSVMINNFEAAYRMLNHGRVPLDDKYPTFRDKMDLFFIDYDWIPMLVQETYLIAMEQRCEDQDIETMANAAEFISQGEVFNEALRSEQDWSLLPDVGLCSSIAPCLLIKGHSNYPGFPQWLGKNSTATKIKRMVRELKAAMGHNAQAGRRAIQVEYVPLVLYLMYKDLMNKNLDEVISIMDDFHITNDMFKEHLLDLCLDKNIREKIEQIPAPTKSAFTREFNKVHKDFTAVKKGKGATKAVTAVVESESEEDDPMLDEEEQIERRKAKEKAKEQADKLKAERVDKFTMIQADLNDQKEEKAKPSEKAKTPAAKKKKKAAGGAKAKAKTQKAKEPATTNFDFLNNADFNA